MNRAPRRRGSWRLGGKHLLLDATLDSLRCRLRRLILPLRLAKVFRLVKQFVDADVGITRISVDITGRRQGHAADKRLAPYGRRLPGGLARGGPNLDAGGLLVGPLVGSLDQLLDVVVRALEVLNRQLLLRDADQAAEGALADHVLILGF